MEEKIYYIDHVGYYIFAAMILLGVAGVAAFKQRHSAKRCMSILLAGIIVAAIPLFWPRYQQISLEREALYPQTRSITYSLYYGLKAIAGGQQLDEMEKLVFQASEKKWFQGIYLVLNYFIFLAAPLLTSSLIVSMIGDLWDRIRCRFFIGRKYHVFSELNANALRLAGKLREKNPKEKLVFCAVKKVDENLISRARSMGAALLYEVCETAKLRIQGRKIQFTLISASEDENLRCAEALICKYKDVSGGNIVINAFAESGTGIQVVENMNKGSIGVRFVDGTALLCNNLLLEHPLDVLPEGCGTISVAIIGCDKTGMRMLKTAAWCGQTNDLDLKIRVFDKNAAYQEKRLRAECPELMEYCDISFITTDARTTELEEKIMAGITGSPDATCIVMAMGEDELNMAVAERLFRLYRYHNGYTWTPKILVRIRNSTKSGIYRGEKNEYLEKRNIYPFGCLEDVFSDSILFHSYLENLSFAVQLCYDGKLPTDPSGMTTRELQRFFASEEIRKSRSKFMQSEYDRRSSMAAALHIPVKLRRCGSMADEERIPTKETIEEFWEALEREPNLQEQMARMEHERWNQFMRSEGYIRADGKDLEKFHKETGKNRDDLSKRHLCLVDWDQLENASDTYLEVDPTKKKDFKAFDLNVIAQIPDILLLAKRMEEVEPEDAV